MARRYNTFVSDYYRKAVQQVGIRTHNPQNCHEVFYHLSRRADDGQQIPLHFQKLFVKTSSGASYTDPVISSLALEAKTLTMVTIMKALKEIVEEESLHIVTKSGAQTRL